MRMEDFRWTYIKIIKSQKLMTKRNPKKSSRKPLPTKTAFSHNVILIFTQSPKKHKKSNI